MIKKIKQNRIIRHRFNKIFIFFFPKNIVAFFVNGIVFVVNKLTHTKKTKSQFKQ